MTESLIHFDVPSADEDLASEAFVGDAAEPLDEVPALWAVGTLAKVQAVRNLADTLAKDFPDHVAAAYARAAVDPADFRRRLALPAEIRVPGGVLLTVSTALWTPGIGIFPTNNREAEDRLYPFAARDDDDLTAHTLWQLESGERNSVELVLRVGRPPEVVASLEKSYDFLLRNNDLRSSVAEHGILMPVTVAPLTLVHDDETPPITILAAADGSSRSAASHRNLGVSPFEIFYELTASDREYRRRISDVLNAQMRGQDMTATERHRLRSIQTPATVVIGFRPDPGSTITFHQAVMSLVGFIHVEPPKKWGPAGELDAKADAVLEALEAHGVVNSWRRRYMAGLLTPEQAEQSGLSPWPDERAAFTLRTLLDDRNHAAVVAGVKRLVVRRTRVTPGQKVQIAVEMGIRSFRHSDTPTAVNTSRVALVQVYDLPEFEEPWVVTRRPPAELLRAAIEELASPTRTGPALRELAVLGAFYLAQYRVLHRVDRVVDVDNRDAGPILRAVMRSAQGLHVLARAIVDGRQGRRPTEVDSEAQLVRTESGQNRSMDEGFLARTFPEAAARAMPERPPSQPETELTDLVDEVVSRVDQLVAALESLASVPGQYGRPLVHTVGIPYESAERLLGQLARVSRTLQRYGVIDEARVDEREQVTEDDSVSTDDADNDTNDSE
jgi:hypothetical protein